MNHIKLIIITTLSLLLFSITGSAVASSVSIVASGYIHTIDTALRGNFTTGDAFTMTYTYDTTTPDTDRSFGTQRGAYWGAISTASLTVGSYSLVMSGGEIIIDNNLSVFGGIVDRYQASMRDRLAPFTGATVAGLLPYYTAIDLVNLDGTALSNDSLLLAAPNLLDFENPTFEFAFAEGYDSTHAWGVQYMYGIVTSITQVPEPSTLFLLGSGLVGLGFIRRKF